jgi:ribosome biogenesis GTPase
MVIDNPGLREIAIGSAASGIGAAFGDVLALADGCRYPDCRHEGEPGCAVRAAVEEGILPEARLDSYLRLVREAEFQAEKAEIGLKRMEKKKWKGIGAEARRFREKRGH